MGGKSRETSIKTQRKKIDRLRGGEQDSLRILENRDTVRGEERNTRRGMVESGVNKKGSSGEEGGDSFQEGGDFFDRESKITRQLRRG